MGKIKAKRRGYKNPVSASFNALFYAYKYHAARRKFAFKLSRRLFTKLVTSTCSYCGVAPKSPFNSYLNKDGSRKSVKTITLARALQATALVNGIDRLDNRFGYTPKNSVPACTECNQAKSNKTLKAFESWLNRIILYRNTRTRGRNA